MKKRYISVGEEARKKLQSGYNQLNEIVSKTLGPKGRNSILWLMGNYTPTITKDGVSVAKEVYLEDPVENAAAQILKEVSMRTAVHAGDGTTTATVLATQIVNDGLEAVNAGYNPIAMQRGMEQASKEIVEILKERAVTFPHDDYDRIKSIATISTNNDEELGKLIADAIQLSGEEGTVAVEPSNTSESFVEKIEGIRYDIGYVSHYFINNGQKGTAEFEDPLVLITDQKIRNHEDIIPAMKAAAAAKRPLLVIAEDVQDTALDVLIQNTLNRKIQCCVVRAPGYGKGMTDNLKDIAILTGAKQVLKGAGFKFSNVTEEELGSIKRVVVKHNETILYLDDEVTSKIETALESRINDIKELLKVVEAKKDQEELQKRLAKLTGGIGVLRVAASSEFEMNEKKDRIEDAFHATRAAMEEGYVEGGGVALLRISDEIGSDYNLPEGDKHSIEVSMAKGKQIVYNAIQKPFNQILMNGGVIENDIIDIQKECIKSKTGYNVSTNKWEDFLETGVIDPVKVTRIALENAVSVGAWTITTESMIIPCEEDNTGMKMAEMGMGM